MAKIDQRAALLNSYHLNLEYRNQLADQQTKNKDKIAKLKNDNALIDSKLKALDKAMAGVKGVAQQLNLFEPADYNVKSDKDEKKENAA